MELCYLGVLLEELCYLGVLLEELNLVHTLLLQLAPVLGERLHKRGLVIYLFVLTSTLFNVYVYLCPYSELLVLTSNTILQSQTLQGNTLSYKPRFKIT